MDTHSVYILNYPNGKFYIGCTSDIETRIAAHMSPSSNCATSKMGESYDMRDIDTNIIFSSRDIDEARAVEGRLISSFYHFDDCLNYVNPLGTSTKVNKKISETLKKRHRQGHYDNSYSVKK